MKLVSYNNERPGWPAAGTTPMLILLSLAILVFTVPANAVGLAKGNNAGNDLVERGQLDEALEIYNRVKIEHPDVPEIDYNAANVRFMKGQLDSAVLEFKGALASLSGPIAPNANYNLGNTLYRMQQYDAAVEAYEQALRLNPSDQDAKFNLELALRQMEQDSSQQESDQDKQQEQKPDSSGQNEDQKQEQQNEDRDSTNQDQQQKQEQDQDQKKKDSAQGQPPQEPHEGQGQPKPQPQQVGMTKEDAQRLLDALRDQELEVQKKRLQQVATPAATDKDW